MFSEARMHIKAPVLPLVIRAAKGAPKCLCTSVLQYGAYVLQRKPTKDQREKSRRKRYN